MIDYQKLSKEELQTRLEVLNKEIDALEVADALKLITSDLSMHHLQQEIKNRELQEMQQQLEMSRNRYIELYDFAPVGYMTFDAKGTIVKINLTGSKMLGAEVDKIIGRSFTSYVAPDERRQFLGHLKEVFQYEQGKVVRLERRQHGVQSWRGKQHRIMSLKLKKEDGSKIDVQLESTPYIDEKGNFDRCHSIIMDVSEQRHLEEMKIQAEAELSRMSRVSALGEMATTFAHELTQPLYAISTFAQTGSKLYASGQKNDEQISDIFKFINQQAQRAGEIIRGIREYAQKTEARRAKVDLGEVIDEAVKLVSSSLSKNEVKINLAGIKNLPNVHVDKLQCEQVIVNILLNAIEACGKVGVQDYCIHIRAFETENNFVEVQIEDMGYGIKENAKNKLFDSFYTTKSNGLGMGLSICRTIIESYGGKIWANNNRHNGATFCFTLPLAPDE